MSTPDCLMHSVPECQFQNLSDVQPTDDVALPRLRVLLLADDKHAANVVIDHIDAFISQSIHEIVLVNPIHVRNPGLRVRYGGFDVILIHYSLYVLGDYFLPQKWARAISEFKGLKAQIIQDEHRCINLMKQRMAELKIRVVFSSLDTAAAEKVYDGALLKETNFFSCLPGYVANNYFEFPAPPISERPRHIVYRGRTLPAYLGRHAQEKRIIGEQWSAAAKQLGLSVDIASDEQSRIYGAQWPAFLMSGKATLGVEGGASIFDFDGSITASVLDFTEKNPSATFEETWSATLEQHEGNVVHKTLTPKIFEAIAAKTALILYPGDYRGILVPWKHYIPFERDGSNLDEVSAFLKNNDRMQSLVDQAYDEILGRKDVSQSFYVQKIDYILAKYCMKRSQRFVEKLFAKFRKQYG